MLNRRVSLLLLVFACLVAGCAGVKEASRAYYVDETYDEFESQHVYEQRYNRNGNMNFALDYLNLRIVDPDEGKNDYEIAVLKEGDDVFRFTENPLQLKINEDIVELPFLYQNSDVRSGQNVQKYAWYDIDRETINRLANAERAVAKARTAEGYYTVEYDDSVLDRIDDFMAEYDK